MTRSAGNDASNAGQSVASMQAARCPPAEWPLIDQRPSQPRQFARRHPHLPDDLFDGDFGTKIVAGKRNVDAMGIQPTGADG